MNTESPLLSFADMLKEIQLGDVYKREGSTSVRDYITRTDKGVFWCDIEGNIEKEGYRVILAVSNNIIDTHWVKIEDIPITFFEAVEAYEEGRIVGCKGYYGNSIIWTKIDDPSLDLGGTLRYFIEADWYLKREQGQGQEQGWNRNIDKEEE